MNAETNCITIYQQLIEKNNTQLAQLEKKKNQISAGRIATILCIAAIIYFFNQYGWVIALPILLLIAVFLRLVIIATNNNAAIANTRLLIALNEEEIKIANRQYTHRPGGEEWQPNVHEYAQDLDIFGRASLYQYINRTTAQQAKQLLAEWLLYPAKVTDIKMRQEALKELAPAYEWRQQLQAYGMAKPVMETTRQKIINWLPQPLQFFNNPAWKIIRWVHPIVTLNSLVLYVLDFISANAFALLFIIYLIISLLVSRKITPVYTPLSKIVEEISSLSNSIDCIEKKNFTAPLLLNIQGLLNNKKAAAAIRALKNILDRFDFRLNPVVFIPLNALVLWDLQQVLLLEQWKEKHRPLVNHWFEALAQMETLSTFANVHFNHPNWVFPSFSEKNGTLLTKEMGHPLIEEKKRVNSSFETNDVPQLALITGSNMAGKSTFLRSIGINNVLALAGAPVCAQSFTLYPMRIISSMRIADNLEENTSTFYAELKKLRHIIEIVNRKENVFLLLDEILRGTNSLDRHTGSKALIRQLMQQQATGMIATHDLELAKLTEYYPGRIHNYHFDVQVANEELYFDYKLKEGICKSLNASILMKKIGIEM